MKLSLLGSLFLIAALHIDSHFRLIHNHGSLKEIQYITKEHILVSIPYLMGINSPELINHVKLIGFQLHPA